MPFYGTRPNSLKGNVLDALKHVKMMLPGENGASFDSLTMRLEGKRTLNLMNGKEVDAFVKESIQLYLQSAVLPPLEAAAQKVNKKKGK